MIHPLSNRTERPSQQAANLLHRLHLRGVAFEADRAGDLCYDGPGGALDRADLAELRRLKRQCLEQLAAIDTFTFAALPLRPWAQEDRRERPIADAAPIRATLLRTAKAANYPTMALPHRRAESVAAGAAAWAAFCRTASTRDVLELAGLLTI